MLLERFKAQDLQLFIAGLLKSYEVIGVKAKGEKHFVFGPITTPEEACLDYNTTLLPPKKVMFPQRDEVLQFQRDDGVTAKPKDETKRVLFGVHACDIWGIAMLDWVFADGQSESNYLARRRNTLIIGTDCTPDEECFCNLMRTSVPIIGFDLFLNRVGEDFLVEVGTAKGEALLHELVPTEECGPEDEEALLLQREARQQQFKKQMGTDVENLPLLFSSKKAYESPVWKDVAEPCFSCGSCNLVCPTCYCFEVADKMNWDFQSGSRVRRWDACLLEEFAVVGAGENFRDNRTNRLRHRLYRKFKYLMQRYGYSHCVGCGRCSRACLVHIKPVETVNQLIEHTMTSAIGAGK